VADLLERGDSLGHGLGQVRRCAGAAQQGEQRIAV